MKGFVKRFRYVGVTYILSFLNFIDYNLFLATTKSFPSTLLTLVTYPCMATGLGDRKVIQFFFLCWFSMHDDWVFRVSGFFRGKRRMNALIRNHVLLLMFKVDVAYR